MVWLKWRKGRIDVDQNKERPSPHVLWKLAEGDREKYGALLVEYGWATETNPNKDEFQAGLKLARSMCVRVADDMINNRLPRNTNAVDEVKRRIEERLGQPKAPVHITVKPGETLTDAEREAVEDFVRDVAAEHRAEKLVDTALELFDEAVGRTMTNDGSVVAVRDKLRDLLEGK